MYKEPVFLSPVFQERIWGGDKLRELFNYEIPTNLTGEAWVISAHENGPSIVKNGALKGKSLCELWQEHPYLFGQGTSSKEFPLLIKLLDANDKLSVQVHPDDLYAEKIGERCGKTECWYILDCEEGSEIILGHKARSRDEFQEKLRNGEWDDLFLSLKVTKGDFVYVPSGTLHAIGKGIVILETQQNSDTTYRVYDYERTDSAGMTRELHLDQAIAVTAFPHTEFDCKKVQETNVNLVSTRLISEKYFTVYHWQVSGVVVPALSKDFLLVSVIEGRGKIWSNDQEFELKKGDNYIIPATMGEYFYDGDMELIISHV